MAYIYLNKETNEALIFKNMADMSRVTGIDYDTLKYQFSRKERNEYETSDVRIVKTDLK